MFTYFQVLHNFKIYEKTKRKITKPDEVRILGLHLEHDPYNLDYYLEKTHQDPRATAYQIFLWFEENCPDEAEKWRILIKALGEMDKHKTIMELGLEQMMENAG